MLEVAVQRQDFLELLARGPVHKRDLIDELGHSRSTVDRAIDSLTEAGLVERVDGEFVATYSGRLLLDQLTETRAVAETVTAAGATLNHLPTDVQRESRFFVDADVVSVENSSPAEVLRGITEVLEQSDRFRGASFVANDDRFIDAIYERTVERTAMEVEFLLTPSLAAWLAANYPERMRPLARSDHLACHVIESLPQAFYLAEREGETTAYLGVHGDQGNFVGYVENDTAAAVSWVESRWTAARDGATPLAPHLREAGEWPES
jgi:predicted transcriptional regulator